jgi:hypothetical protein
VKAVPQVQALRRAMLLCASTVAWNTIVGGAAVATAIATGSLALIGFGLNAVGPRRGTHRAIEPAEGYYRPRVALRIGSRDRADRLKPSRPHSDHADRARMDSDLEA